MQKEGIFYTHTHTHTQIFSSWYMRTTLAQCEPQKKPYFYKGNTMSKRLSRPSAPCAKSGVCVCFYKTELLAREGGQFVIFGLFCCCHTFPLKCPSRNLRKRSAKCKQEVENRPAKCAREWDSITHPQNEVGFGVFSGFTLPAPWRVPRRTRCLEIRSPWLVTVFFILRGGPLFAYFSRGGGIRWRRKRRRVIRRNIRRRTTTKK